MTLYRLIRKAHIYNLNHDDGPNYPDTAEGSTTTIWWRGRLARKPDRDFFKRQRRLSLPHGDYEDCPSVGSSDFTYHLQAWEDGEWRFVALI